MVSGLKKSCLGKVLHSEIIKTVIPFSFSTRFFTLKIFSLLEIYYVLSSEKRTQLHQENLFLIC